MGNGNDSVAVLGAGHGGLALAGYLARRGHTVSLWNRSEDRVEPVARQGGIRLASPDSAAAVVPVARATSDLSAALRGVGVVLVAVPACAHAAVARAAAPHLRDGQTILLLPGRTGGALEFRRELREAGCRARVLLGEANTFPFAARCVGPASAVIYGAKVEVTAAALPARLTPRLLADCRPFLPMLRPAGSVLHTGFANLGAILHPVITLLNAERIRAGEVFDFYRDGVTPAVAAALAAADAERLRVARAYGVPACSLRDWIARAYDHHADDLAAAVGGNPAYVGIRAPSTIVHRYLLEDVPTGLVPLLELGEVAGLDLPVLSGLVRRARAALGGDVWQDERTLDRLGVGGLDAPGIRAFVERGLVPAARIPEVVGARADDRYALGMELFPQV